MLKKPLFYRFSVLKIFVLKLGGGVRLTALTPTRALTRVTVKFGSHVGPVILAHGVFMPDANANLYIG